MRSRFLPVADEIEKGLVNSRVVRELGMEGRGHNCSLPDGDWIVAFRGDDFDPWADAFDFGGANEDHLERIFTESAFADGTVDLATVGVAADADIERS